MFRSKEYEMNVSYPDDYEKNNKISTQEPEKVTAEGTANPAFDHDDNKLKNVNGEADDSKPENVKDAVIQLPNKLLIPVVPEDFELFEGYLNEELEDLPRPTTPWYKFVTAVKSSCRGFHVKNPKQIIKFCFALLLLLAFLAYLILCIYQYVTKLASTDQAEGSIRLFWMSALIILCFVIHFLHGQRIKDFEENIGSKLKTFKENNAVKLNVIWWCACIAIVAAFLIWMAIEQSSNLISAVGMLVLLLIAFTFSTDHAMINWQPVISGIVLQFIFAALVLRTAWGFAVFDFLGDRVAEFLQHANKGAEFVFGAGFREHFFAFSVLPVVIFFSSVITVLFHFGVLQSVIRGVGFVMQILMGTTAAESMVAAANIFVGLTEAPLIIRPFLKTMTNSEIHSIMTSGFATIAGSVLAAYISMGAPARHLIAASVMSAPAALGISKLMHPENKKTLTRPEDIKKVKLAKYVNVVEAAGTGAIMSLGVVGAIAANIIAFISILSFINSTLTWLGYRAGMETALTFEFIISYVFYPLAYLMGVAANDCRMVGELVGIKTFINEFVAYQRLGTMKENLKLFKNLTAAGDVAFHWSGSNIIIPAANTTIAGGVIFEDKSIVIATYALCGFSNLGSIGILIGALTAMVPRKKSDFVRCAIRAMIAGSIACFMTAAIAGLFYSNSETGLLG